MDATSLVSRYKRYLHLIDLIQGRLVELLESRKFRVHEDYDILRIFQIDGAPGEIFIIRRAKNEILLRDLTVQRVKSEEFDGAGWDLTSPDTDRQLVEDVVQLLRGRLPGAIERQRRCWQIESMRIAAEDGEPIEEE